MNDGEFRIRTYGFGELAQLYMPNISSKSASARLRAWIERNEVLHFELLETGFKKGLRTLTPEQVRLLVRFIGEP
jgi:hypothetical protein